MSLVYTRRTFVECDSCRAKPGSPALCRECLERREMYSVLEYIRNGNFFLNKRVKLLIKFCEHCKDGMADLYCPEHGR